MVKRKSAEILVLPYMVEWIAAAEHSVYICTHTHKFMPQVKAIRTISAVGFWRPLNADDCAYRFTYPSAFSSKTHDEWVKETGGKERKYKQNHNINNAQ